MKSIFMSFIFAVLSLQAWALTPKDYLEATQIETFDSVTNRNISNIYGKQFSAKVFKAFIEKNSTNLKFKNQLQNFIVNKSTYIPIKNVKIIVNMGLGWDFENADQPYYVKDFINEIKSLGYEVIFLSKYPYAPIEVNVESIRPQLRHILRDQNNKYILLSLCKGTPELLIAAAEIIKKENQLKNKLIGFVNMSGMMGGTFFSSTRFDLVALTSLEKEVDNYSSKMNFEKFDRMQTIVSLPSMTKARITKNLAPILNVSFDNIPAINISGALMSDTAIKNNSPLKMFISYNKALQLYPYANDGFIDVTESRLPTSMFKNQRSLILDSSHLLTDGNFEGLDLTKKTNRVLFYKAIIQSIKDEK
jgi:hypothetical protein